MTPYAPPPGTTALVVEDDETIRETIREVLQVEGYVVRCAASLREARRAVEAEMPALLVLDLGLGDGTGDELLAELAPRAFAPPTVLVSASIAAPDIARRFGVAHMQKPFDLDALLEALRGALERGSRPSVLGA